MPGIGGRPQRLSELLGSSDIAFLANRLQQFFVPTAAIGGLTATTGTSTTATVQDAATIALSSGVLNWSFKKNFTAPPAVTATPEGTGTGQLYVDSVATGGCVVKSTNGADNRTVHLTATQVSQGD